MKDRKLLILLIVGILLIAAFFGCYKYRNIQLSKTNFNSLTQDWEKLSLLNNNVSVKYPSTIYLDKLGTDNSAIALPYKGADIMNYSGFRIDAHFVPEYADYNQTIKHFIEYFKPYSEFKQIKLSNGIVRMSGTLNGDLRIVALANYQGKAIVFDYLQQRESISSETFDQILSTFKSTQ